MHGQANIKFIEKFIIYYFTRHTAEGHTPYSHDCKMSYFYSKTNEMHQFLKFIYLFYMFWVVFPSIIRGPRLYIQQQVYVKQILLPAC